MGAGSLEQLFDEKYYRHLEGGILESFGRLFKNNVSLYIYPLIDDDTGAVIDHRNARINGGLQHLHRYLVEDGSIQGVTSHDPNILHIFSRDVLRRIKEQDPSWEAMVPEAIAELIKQRQFFGFRPLSDAVVG